MESASRHVTSWVLTK